MCHCDENSNMYTGKGPSVLFPQDFLETPLMKASEGRHYSIWFAQGRAGVCVDALFVFIVMSGCVCPVSSRADPA